MACNLLEPNEVMVGNKTYTLHKFPATVGREILMTYCKAQAVENDYSTSNEVMLKIISYVTVNLNGTDYRLSSSGLVDQHVSNAEVLFELERKMLDYNYSFFATGGLLDFYLRLIGGVSPSNTEMSMD